eukprot:5430317-Pleurochrysis_carterae.AAC.8
MRDELLPDCCTGRPRVPYAGERLGRLIVKFLPTALAAEGRALLRKLIVLQERAQQRKQRHRADHAPSLNGARGGTGLGRIQQVRQKGQKGECSGCRDSQTRTRLRTSQWRPYELPSGQWCSKGTCHSTRDKANPGGLVLGIRAGQGP